MENGLFNVNQDKIIYKIEDHGVGILEVNKDPCVITFPSFSNVEFLLHGFSTRLGGVSTGHLSSMNLSFSRGDSPKNVKTNFKRICSSIGVNVESLVFSDQVHGTKIHKVADTCDLAGIDGLITNVPGLTLVTFYADCVPLYFVDTKKKAIGLSHSGWRGTVNKIGRKTIEAMKKEFGSGPKDILAVIGPSICRDCYEISQDVAEEFKKNYSKEQASAILESKGQGKYQLDLWLANLYVLMEGGIPRENISLSGICTCCNSSLLFSHRASKGQRGNLAAFLSIAGK